MPRPQSCGAHRHRDRAPGSPAGRGLGSPCCPQSLPTPQMEGKRGCGSDDDRRASANRSRHCGRSGARTCRQGVQGRVPRGARGGAPGAPGSRPHPSVFTWPSSATCLLPHVHVRTPAGHVAPALFVVQVNHPQPRAERCAIAQGGSGSTEGAGASQPKGRATEGAGAAPPGLPDL